MLGDVHNGVVKRFRLGLRRRSRRAARLNDRLSGAGPGLKFLVAQHGQSLVLERIRGQLRLGRIGRVRDDDEQGRENIVGDQTGAAGRHIGQGQTGQRNHQRDAADHGEHLEGHGEHQSGSEQLAEAILDFHGGDKAGGNDEQVEHQNGQDAHQTEFLAQRGVDEIGVRKRNERRMALAETGAEHAA